MGGRVAEWLREEFVDEPLADTKAETTVCILQLTLSVTLNAMTKENSRD
jgi:hypothetical protein